MRRGTLLNRGEIFAAAATIAAHASVYQDGFRQRDVRFLLQLFFNWVERTLGNSPMPISNTQIYRYLEDLVKEGSAKANRRSTQPVYRLTRVGLLELVSRIVNKREENLPDQFFFLCYFLSCYGPKLVSLVQAEGQTFPHSLQLELTALLDVDAIIKREKKRVQNEIIKLRKRIEDSLNAAKLARRLSGRNASQREIIDEVEKSYPYELNSQKPLSELLSSLPVDLIRWELEEGNTIRAERIWAPSLALLENYSVQLTNLLLGK